MLVIKVNQVIGWFLLIVIASDYVARLHRLYRKWKTILPDTLDKPKYSKQDTQEKFLTYCSLNAVETEFLNTRFLLNSTMCNLPYS